jgi:hypothetical protein
MEVPGAPGLLPAQSGSRRNAQGTGQPTGLEVRAFGGIKIDPLSKESLWAIPPSPPEVLTFGVEKLPWIIIFDQQNNEIGKIIENPKHTSTIEEEIVFLLNQR